MNSNYMHQCPVCGKDFAIWVTDEWVYKKVKALPSGAIRKTYFCSWHCLRETEKIKGGKR